MGHNKMLLVIFLVVIWSSFGIWEIYVLNWAKTVSGPIIRVDLIFIVPILLATTFYVIFKIMRKTRLK